MVNRVLLNANGMKVSAPGNNVLTAPEAQLLFNSQWSALDVLMRGSFSPGDDTTTTINYGKTFPSRPPTYFIVGRRRNLDGGGFGWRWSHHIGTFVRADTDGVLYFCNVFDNRFVFENDDNDVDVVKYVVWDFNL